MSAAALASFGVFGLPVQRQNFPHPFLEASSRASSCVPLLTAPLTVFLCAQRTIASPGRGILAMDESNATVGKRLDSIGLENNEANRQAYREMLVSTKVCVSELIQ